MRFRRADANQPEIVKAFRSLGCKVHVTSSLGGGFPDLVVGRPERHKVVLVEIKDGSKPPSHRELTKDEKTFRDAWRGSYAVVEGIPDVVLVVNLLLA